MLDLVLRGGTVYDGLGAEGVALDVGVQGDRVVALGRDLPEAARVLDVDGLAVTPGFVNALSHAWASLQLDGSGSSDVLQGVTTEVFGEAYSLGPSDERLGELLGDTGGARVVFDRLGDGLDALVAGGTAPNVASLVGGHNLRVLGAGFADRPLEPAELDRVCGVLDEELADGALGVGTALIYPPGSWAGTEELAALCRVVGRHGGTYVSHLRSEGDRLLECLDELLHLGQVGGCRVECYHLKAVGRHNWPKMAQAVERIEAARQAGQPVTADMYPYTAGGTALAASIPPRFHAGGPQALLERLADPAVRNEVVAALRTPGEDFENLFLGAGGGDGVVFPADLDDGTPAAGRTLTEVADDLGLDDATALVEVVRRAPGTGVLYEIAGEDGLELGLRQPWVSIGSDAPALTPGTPAAVGPTHPRAYGTFARFLGRYVRERGVTTFADAVRRMTSLPCDTFGLAGRGRLVEGAFADVVVLDPATVADTATYAAAHAYAVGVRHVLVNGEPVVLDGAVTAARPGRRLRRDR